MNHHQRHRDNPGQDYDSLVPRLRFVGTPVSLAASFLPPVSSDGTKLGLECSTSKIVPEQVHKARHHVAEASLSAHASKGESGSGTPNIPFPASSRHRTWLFRQLMAGMKTVHSQLMVGMKTVHNQQRENETSLCNPASSKGMPEARGAYQVKSTRCNSLISGRLSAKAKKARSLKP
jgi:hypothetical protein